MFGIKAIGTYLPLGRQDNMSLLEKFAIDADFLHEKIGVLTPARMAPGTETSDLCVKAFENLVQKTGLDNNDIDLLVVVTQNPDGYGLPHTSAIVHKKLDMPVSCFAFDLGLGCSGFVAGLAAVKGFLQATGKKRAVMITADPYSKILDTEDKDTILIFGDGAAATLIETTDLWQIGAFDLGTDGQKCDATVTNTKRLVCMKGRTVLNFCVRNVPGSVARALEQNGLKKSDIDHFVLHPGSQGVVNAIVSRLKIAPPPFHPAFYGNTVSSSVPFILADLDPKNDQTVLISAFGVGLGWATTVLQTKNATTASP